ncbi:hypothetical protein CK503_10345 [Aliifodinibius salipaludis]|uniref:Polymer-forming cytoskeletal protein n=1 Tax=Fodinibius salipaludis TaxID=2032627 RepID=A0A2A2G8Q7_9BACT|nr:polymer-forming cytoskeletal protein [Aliifodinibius salipaludis]PAU93550.1 hypothetical protein CK503_10345 [Aliifodinibius salipaludis]
MNNTDTLISKSSFFQGNVFGKSIIVEGRVVGDLKATSSILIKEDGRVEGDIQAPTVYLEKGYHHEGAIYLDDSENASPEKKNMKEPKSKLNDKDRAKVKEDESPKAQPVSGRSKSKLW